MTIVRLKTFSSLLLILLVLFGSAVNWATTEDARDQAKDNYKKLFKAADPNDRSTWRVYFGPDASATTARDLAKREFVKKRSPEQSIPEVIDSSRRDLPWRKLAPGYQKSYGVGRGQELITSEDSGENVYGY